MSPNMINFIDSINYIFNFIICAIVISRYFISCVIHHFTFTIYNRTDQQVIKLDKRIVIFVGKLHNTLNVS